MSSAEQTFQTEELHPIDIVETLAEHHDWDFDRVADDQIAMAIEGAWRTYSLTLAWSGHDETLRLICAFDMDPPEAKRPALYETLERANDRCWAGAFTLWVPQKLMAYKYGLILSGGATATADQIAEMVRIAVTQCERYFPAFQLVCWGEETPAAALEVAMSEAYGRA
ncbi:MAG: YbjN domain-containing protein [Pseudomonadota bacterium]